MRLTKNFWLSELTCRDGTPVPEEFEGNAQLICDRAQVLRDFIGRPLTVRSGYRTPEYNTRIGGAKKSKHMTASALDLHSKSLSAEDLAAIYEGLVRIKVVRDGGLGVYPRPDGGWIHIDLGRPRRWRG